MNLEFPFHKFVKTTDPNEDTVLFRSELSTKVRKQMRINKHRQDLKIKALPISKEKQKSPNKTQMLKPSP